ncbi:C-3 sterol dehydrogenase/C-4 decarboxylase-like protein [Trichodelitschia bisporula]|uniref:Sterol-4-alpha-carboxylate 3-dehydrogenase ERG26, decarboxylating n=1 Tax=Trichodelitschia bisporula TaxID=703511 RepID=A0A6G1HXH6_9PEZI|nr:C-3 sterol dehydrogenase/C-4 decarboxylase-like protein [Trichodelitschia bisporula]
MADLLQGSLGHVVVVGGCGFLGHHIVQQLSHNVETRVSVLDLFTNRNRIDSPRISYYDCDITNLETVREIFAKTKPDVVIHTASPVFSGPQNELMYRVNVVGTDNLLKAAQEYGTRAFVYTSSASAIMGPVGTDIINADERWPVVYGDAQPEYYTTTKVLAEKAVLAANRTPATLLTCAIRPAGIFGEGDVQALPGMLTASRKGQSKFQLGPNNNLFDFTYVGNVAYAHLLAAVALMHTHKLSVAPLDSERVDGEAFFITNDQPVYFWDFARTVWREAGDKVAVDPSKIWILSTSLGLLIAGIMEWIFWIFGKTPNLDRSKVRFSAMSRYYSIDKAKKRLGYEPIVDIEEGIKRGMKDLLRREAEANAQKTDKKGQ